MAYIHPTAQVASGAELAEDTIIGPYCVIGPEVRIGPGTIVYPHSVIEGRTVIGARNKIGPFASLGGSPQHLAYKDEPTSLIIGDENILREYVSVHRGTILDQGKTQIGNRCYLMAYTHVGHDCVLEDEVILTNATQLGGHVRIGFGAVLGGGSFVHQFCRIGELAFVSGMTGVDKDVPPFLKVFGAPARITGLNLVGLRRRKVPSQEIRTLSHALKIYLHQGTIKEITRELQKKFGNSPLVSKFIHFLETPSQRGFVRREKKDQAA